MPMFPNAGVVVRMQATGAVFIVSHVPRKGLLAVHKVGESRIVWVDYRDVEAV